MTLKEAKAQAKQVGVRLTYNPDVREYIVHGADCHITKVDSNPMFGDHKACYFTPDRDDAVATARTIAQLRDGPIAPVALDDDDPFINSLPF